MLKADNITYTYPGAEKPAIENISLELGFGEMLAITGPNGSGKTTLAMVLAGVIRPDSGMVTLFDSDLFSEKGRALARKKIALLFQDPQDGILTTSVEREIAFGPENLAFSQDKLRGLVGGLLHDFGLTEFRSRPVEELSGGGVERCALAAAVATDPAIIILDEPDSFLDFSGKRRFWKEIDRLRAAGSAIIHITQSRTIAEKADKRIILGDNTQHNIALNDNIINTNISSITSSNNLLSIDNLVFSYDSEIAVDDVNLKIHAGECVAILGASGAGKTTLARLCAGLYKPDSGHIVSNGRVGISFQFPAKQLFAETVLGDVAFGPKSLGIGNPEERARNALLRVGIDESFYGRSPFELSDGEQRRVGIAGILATDPSTIIFDEPAATLDRKGRRLFIELVSRLVAENRAVGIITHDLELVAACAKRAIVLDNGRLVYDGEMAKIMREKDLRLSFGLGTDEDIFSS
ncbi:hypothetical protein DRQ36_09580 [bacterium]|nr:MAG: hypothetical protein DRQ36_09580 [bacterium]